MATYSIDDMAKAGCSSPRAVRYWEEQGLLGTVDRTDGDHRRYSEAQIKRARTIAAAQFGSFPLESVRGMLDGYDVEAHSAIVARLSAQIDLAVRLLEELPPPPTPMVYDL